MSTNIQSPGSQSSSKGSKSSSGLEDDLYFDATNHYKNVMKKFDDAINPITNLENIGTNYFADTNGPDDLELDDIDEIDTNNMAIYSGAPLKKDRKYFGGSSSSSSSASNLVMKKDGKQNKPIVVPQTGKSLLNKNNIGGKSLPEIKIDILNEEAVSGEDVLAQAVDAAEISPNSLTGQSVVSNYDENSRVRKS